jgi:hypothetical protein
LYWIVPLSKINLADVLELHFFLFQSILNDKKASGRLIESYKLMLNFYGMKLADEGTGEIEKASNWEERFAHLNRYSMIY